MRPIVSMIAATAIAAAGTAANADSIPLDEPIQARSLHDGRIDMFVYYVSQTDHFEVVATYVTRDAPCEPLRLSMELADGDTVSFGLPGHLGVLYSFQRDGSAVEVSTTSVQPHTQNF